MSIKKIFFLFLVNKRLDDWVTEEYLDTRKVQFPRPGGSQTGQNTGVTTPKKLIPMIPGSGNVSRPPSPTSSNELVNGNAVLAAALQKKLNRKRKALPPSLNNSFEIPKKLVIPDAILTPTLPPLIAADTNNEDSEEGVQPSPRQSGSMVTHQDDVVTRMKNIEMIELGKHRIKPWYFAPYPQVSF